jgi:hypothetical protein
VRSASRAGSHHAQSAYFCHIGCLQGGGLYLLSLLVNMTHAAAITMRNKAV